MCMITDKGRCLVAEKPVTCYKAMYPIDHADASAYKFRSEYMGYIYTLGEDYALRKSEKFPEANPDGAHMRVGKGFHSYAGLEDARGCVMRNNLSLLFGARPLVTVMCEIPAGARYWEGDEEGRPGYCSDRIRVVAWKTWCDEDWIRCVREPSRSDVNHP